MSSPPLVSVLVPAFNHARWITRTLDSILKDGYPNIELLVLDDGSTDETHRLAKEWVAAHGRALAHGSVTTRPNRGLTPTLNELLSHARGTLVVPLASDDLLLPGSLGLRRTYLEEHPEIDAVFGDCIVVDHDDSLLHSSGLFAFYHSTRNGLRHHLSNELISNFSLPGPLVMYRRDAFLTMGGYNETLAVEDWDFYLRFALRGTLAFLDAPVAAYRVHSRNARRHTGYRRRASEDVLRVSQTHINGFQGWTRILLSAQGLAAKLELLATPAPISLALRGGATTIRVSMRLFEFARRRFRASTPSSTA